MVSNSLLNSTVLDLGEISYSTIHGRVNSIIMKQIEAFAVKEENDWLVISIITKYY